MRHKTKLQRLRDRLMPKPNIVIVCWDDEEAAEVAAAAAARGDVVITIEYTDWPPDEASHPLAAT